MIKPNTYDPTSKKHHFSTPPQHKSNTLNNKQQSLLVTKFNKHHQQTSSIHTQQFNAAESRSRNPPDCPSPAKDGAWRCGRETRRTPSSIRAPWVRPGPGRRPGVPAGRAGCCCAVVAGAGCWLWGGLSALRRTWGGGPYWGRRSGTRRSCGPACWLRCVSGKC